jgi:Tol biopolymer transport system component
MKRKMLPVLGILLFSCLHINSYGSIENEQITESIISSNVILLPTTNTKTILQKSTTPTATLKIAKSSELITFSEPRIYPKLDSGIYIAYQNSQAVYLLDANGEKIGKWFELSNGIVNSISPNGELLEIIIYSGGGYNIVIYNMSINEFITIVVSGDQRWGYSNSVWSPDSQMMAITGCDEGIIIVDINKNEVINRITSPVKEIPYYRGEDRYNPNYPGVPFWSPNGNWIAYFVYYYDEPVEYQGGIVETPHGPYVTETNCLLDNSSCDEYSYNLNEMVSNEIDTLSDGILAWTPENYLALFAIRNGPNIYLLDVMMKKQNDYIELPFPIGSYSANMRWSPDGEKILFSTPPIGFIYSIKNKLATEIDIKNISTMFWINKRI